MFDLPRAYLFRTPAQIINDYKSFWSSADSNKKKGSGVGLLISQQWEKHLGQVERKSEYWISANFMFKQLEVMVIMVYILPNDKEKKNMIEKVIKVILILRI